jgi:hypothetical protein
MKIRRNVLTIMKKEEISMKKCILFSVVLAVAMCFAIATKADAVTDKTVSVTASATISGTTSLTANATAFTYGTTSADAFPTVPASKNVVLTYASNYNPWKIDVYTNNTQIPLQAVTNGMYAKGGLVAGSGPYSVVPLKWIAKNPASAIPTITATTFQTSYNFVKDIRDEDDPVTTTTNESWASSFAGGYPNVAWGPVVGGGGVCVDPTNSAAGPNQYRGEAISGTVAIYVAGLFSTGGVTPASPASAGVYGGTIYFDLYHP